MPRQNLPIRISVTSEATPTIACPTADNNRNSLIVAFRPILSVNGPHRRQEIGVPRTSMLATI